MNREMEHINVLAGEIGYRVAATEGEHRAANYIEQELQNYGLQGIRQEPFRSPSEGVNSYFPYILAMIGSSLIAPLAPRLGLGGMLASPIMLVGEIRTGRRLLTRLLKQGTSHNVIGILPARGECKVRVVLMAHYDSVRVRGYMKPERGKSPRRFVMPLAGFSYLAALGAAAVGILARLKQNDAMARSAGRVSGIAGGTLLAAASPLLAGQLIPGFDGEGANDNASGVAVLLSLAEQMSKEGQFLEHTEVWFVGTGSEETGLRGARALVDRHGKELKDAYFFAIDTVGAGRIHYTTQERFMRSADVPHEVVDILVTASEKGQHGAMPHILRAGGTDASAMLGKRFKAASICCLVKDGKWPEINWPTDVRRYIEVEQLPKVTAFMKDVLCEIDRRVCYNKAR